MFLQPMQRTDQRQSFVVNAQLQQAIHLLQMNNQDLAAYIEKEGEENPFLEKPTIEKHRDDQREKSFSALSPVSSKGGDSEFDYISSLAEMPAPSLYAHVSDQLDLMFDNPAERLIAECFLEVLEPTGWLGEPLEVIASRASLEIEAAEEFLLRLQAVEPAGLFARSLKECLSLQARKRELKHRRSPHFWRI